jgi:hypothetical protein
MSSYVRAAEAIRDAFQCVVIIIHHCGLDESRPRGHSALPAAVDAQLAVTRQNDMATILVELMRDGPEGAEIASKVLSIEVGMDANGRPLTSLVVMPADAPESTPAHRSGKWPPSLKVFHAALTDAILSHGIDHHIENGPTVRAADLERVREAFYRSYAVAGDEGSTAEQKRNSRRRAFSRNVERAQSYRLLGVRGYENGTQLVWPATF